jgi:Skp family chaperone for outer membrane proteins
MRHIILTAVLLTTLSVPAFAEEKKASAAPAPVVGVLDTRLVLETSTAGKGIASQLNTRREALQKEAESFEKKVRETEQALVKQRKDLKADEFEKKRKEYEQSFMKTRQDILKKGNGIEQMRRNALAKLQNEIAKVSADVAEERKILLVVDRESVVIAHESLDITQEVLTRLNKAVQSIPLSAAKQ